MANYEYIGYLRSILYAPDANETARAESVTFPAPEIARWTVKDHESDIEWKRIPVHRSQTDEGVRLVGRFEEVGRIDLVDRDAPRFWVPLGTIGHNDDRLPIDLVRFPVIEVTYRCTSPNARPAIVWTYPGGKGHETLPRAEAMRTVAKRLPVDGFPAQLDSIVVRLYAATRTTETVDIESIRFRAMTPAEVEACERDKKRLAAEPRPRTGGNLDTFAPLGVIMHAGMMTRSAELLGITLPEYLDLAAEDIARHHHNVICMQAADEMTDSEWESLLTAAREHGLQVVSQFNVDACDEQAVQEVIDRRVRPLVDSTDILAWRLGDEAADGAMNHLLRARAQFEKADPNHSVAVCTSSMAVYAAIAPHFAVSGLCYHESHSPWYLGEVVREHSRLCQGRQFWLEGPGFVYATDTPEWSTCPEMRLMVNLAFANGARGWFTHAYHNDPFWVTGSNQRTLTGPFLTFSDLWLELDRRMERFAAISPLLLETAPASIPRLWYAESAVAEDNFKLPEGMAPVSSYRLKGPDYDLFFVVSNDVRGMSALYANIPANALEGNQIYDLTDFIQERVWEPMNLERHLEMFPGQAQVVLLARPEVCDRIQHVVSRHLIGVDRQQLSFYLRIARTYNLDLAPVEDLLAKASTGDSLIDLELTDRARDMLVDLIYSTPEIHVPRSHIIQISSAICACDGVLCRMMTRGKVEQAKELGQKVVPLAREVTRYRIELRRGRGAEIAGALSHLVNDALAVLTELRSVT